MVVRGANTAWPALPLACFVRLAAAVQTTTLVPYPSACHARQANMAKAKDFSTAQIAARVLSAFPLAQDQDTRVKDVLRELSAVLHQSSALSALLAGIAKTRMLPHSRRVFFAHLESLVQWRASLMMPSAREGAPEVDSRHFQAWPVQVNAQGTAALESGARQQASLQSPSVLGGAASGVFQPKEG